MKPNVLYALCCAAVISFAQPNPAAAVEMVVTADRANVRTSPSRNGAVLGQATRGLRVNVVSTTNSWSQIEIRTGDEVFYGWISSSLLAELPSSRVGQEVTYNTEFGVLIGRPGETRQEYFYEGQKIDFGEYSDPAIVSQQFGNNFLMFELGGALCPASYRWLTISADGPRLSDSFGTCSEAGEVTEGDGWLEVEMPTALGQIERWRFDGEKVELRVVDKPQIETTNSMDPTSWIGKSAFQYLSASATEDYLLSLMSLSDLEALTRSSYETVQPFTDDGDWIVAVGRFNYMAMAQYELESRVMVALSKRTNEAFIHFLDEKDDGSYETQQWGTSPQNLSGTMRKAMSR